MAESRPGKTDQPKDHTNLRPESKPDLNFQVWIGISRIWVKFGSTRITCIQYSSGMG